MSRWARAGELVHAEQQLGALRAAAQAIATMPPQVAGVQASRVCRLSRLTTAGRRNRSTGNSSGLSRTTSTAQPSPLPRSAEDCPQTRLRSLLALPRLTRRRYGQQRQSSMASPGSIQPILVSYETRAAETCLRSGTGDRW
jgi:hypothetical protein